MNNYRVLGLMSGTSLDGVDIACCDFHEENGHWQYAIVQAETFPYPAAWKTRLAQLPDAGAMELASAHAAYGHYLGHACADLAQ